MDNDSRIHEEESLVDILMVEGVNSKGYGTIPKAVMKDHRLPIQAKAIYAYFCSYAGAGRRAFPGRGVILNDLKISKDFFYKNLNLLKTLDYIRVKQESCRNGRFGRNIYTLVPCPAVQDTVKAPCPMPPDTVGQDTNINKYINNINLSINPTYIDQYTMDRIDDFTRIVKENIEYDVLINIMSNQGLIKSILTLIVDTLCSGEKSYMINGVRVDAAQVKKRFMELSRDDVSSVILGIENLAEPIHNPRNYIITALYNAPATGAAKWASEVSSLVKQYHARKNMSR